MQPIGNAESVKIPHPGDPNFVVESKIENGKLVDNIDYPFVNDPQILGKWQVVDFVDKPEHFTTGTVQKNLPLQELNFLRGGRLNIMMDNKVQSSVQRWTKGLVIAPDDKTASKYEIRKVDKAKYLFYEWKSGDYTVRHQKPYYYVLKRASRY